MTNDEVLRALTYLRQSITLLKMRGDTESMRTLMELKNVEAVIKNLTGRK